MALSRTDLLGQVSTAGFGTGAFTTSSFTPPNNSLLIVAVESVEVSGDADYVNQITITDSAGLTWTRRRDSVGGGPTFSTAVIIFTAPVSTGASMTLTLDAGTREANHYALSAVAYTGHDTGSPIGASGENQQAGGFASPPFAASLTLDSAPALTSEVFAALGVDGSGAVTPGAGWLEIHENFVGFGGLETEVRNSSTSTTVAWIDASSGGTIFNWAGVAIEVRQASTETFFYVIRQNSTLR